LTASGGTGILYTTRLIHTKPLPFLFRDRLKTQNIPEVHTMGTLSLSRGSTPVASFDSGIVREYLNPAFDIKQIYGHYSEGFSGVNITDRSGSSVGWFDPSSGLLRSSSGAISSVDIAYVQNGTITDTNISHFNRRTLAYYTGDPSGAAAAYALYLNGFPASPVSGDSRKKAKAAAAEATEAAEAAFPSAAVFL